MVRRGKIRYNKFESRKVYLSIDTYEIPYSYGGNNIIIIREGKTPTSSYVSMEIAAVCRLLVQNKNINNK